MLLLSRRQVFGMMSDLCVVEGDSGVIWLLLPLLGQEMDVKLHIKTRSGASRLSGQANARA